MEKYPFQRRDAKTKDERFMKFYFGNYTQRNDTFFLAFTRIRPEEFSDRLYYDSTSTNLIGNESGTELKFQVWKH